MKTIAAILVLALAGVGCVRQYYDKSGRGNDGGSPTSPTTLPTSHTIEYRVLGSRGIRSAVISYGNAQDGTTDTTTLLPWTTQRKTTKDTLFVFLSVTPIEFGTIRAQVFVDGSLFREATLDDSFVLDPLTISGTVDLTTLRR